MENAAKRVWVIATQTNKRAIFSLGVTASPLGNHSPQAPSPTSENIRSHGRGLVRRRSFLKGLGMADATMLHRQCTADDQGKAQAAERQERNGKLSKGDVAILDSWLRRILRITFSPTDGVISTAIYTFL